MKRFSFLLLLVCLSVTHVLAGNYKNFKATVYVWFRM